MSSHPNRTKVKNWPKHLKAFRAAHNLTQGELANALMISRRLVENWESGVNDPPAYLKLALRKIEQSFRTAV